MIDEVRWGEITINGRKYFSDMAVFWDGSIKYITKSHIFNVQEFLLMLQKKPEIIVVGTGIKESMSIEQAVRDMAEDKGIELFDETSKKAADIYNAFVFQGKKVAALIHTTC